MSVLYSHTNCAVSLFLKTLVMITDWGRCASLLMNSKQCIVKRIKNKMIEKQT